MSYLIFTYALLVILMNIYFKKKKLFSNYTGDKHQLFSSQKNIPLVGGFFLIFPIILISPGNIIYALNLILIFLVGLFSDQKILISPKKRFFFQLTIVIISVIFLDQEILSSKLNFFDNLLENAVFNIFFTSFCLLILINGSNFIDGLNGLLLVYMTLVIFVLLKLGLLNTSIINNEAVTYLIFFLVLLIFLNFMNFLMLGDSGAYALSFFVGYMIINSHNSNPNISPYFFITLLWYPCFENLFSIIRKLKTKFSPFSPDNKHFHQLLYATLKKKVIKTVKVGQRPRGIIMSKDGKLVLICASDDDRVEVRDAETMKLKYYLPSGPDPELFILSPEDDTLYIANEDDAMVTVVDMTDKMIVDDIPVGVEPEGMGLTNDGKILVNTSETTNMAHLPYNYVQLMTQMMHQKYLNLIQDVRWTQQLITLLQRL